MRTLPALLTIALSCVASAASADATTTCFGRTYDAAHLTAHPTQQVRDIRVRRVEHADTGNIAYDMRLLFRDDPRTFRALPGCWNNAGQMECVIDCDGGVMRPVHAPDGGLTITTRYLRAETGDHPAGDGGCTDPVTRSIADQAADGSDVETVFVLFPRARPECAWGDDADAH